MPVIVRSLTHTHSIIHSQAAGTQPSVCNCLRPKFRDIRDIMHTGTHYSASMCCCFALVTLKRTFNLSLLVAFIYIFLFVIKDDIDLRQEIYCLVRKSRYFIRWLVFIGICSSHKKLNGCIRGKNGGFCVGWMSHKDASVISFFSTQIFHVRSETTFLSWDSRPP